MRGDAGCRRQRGGEGVLWHREQRESSQALRGGAGNRSAGGVGRAGEQVLRFEQPLFEHVFRSRLGVVFGTPAQAFSSKKGQAALRGNAVATLNKLWQKGMLGDSQPDYAQVSQDNAIVDCVFY